VTGKEFNVRFLKFALFLALIPTFSHAQYGSHEHSDSIGRGPTSEPVNNFVLHGSVVLPSGMLLGGSSQSSGFAPAVRARALMRMPRAASVSTLARSIFKS